MISPHRAPAARGLRTVAAIAVLAAALCACGGGGEWPQQPSEKQAVSSVTIDGASYGGKMLITLSGTRLDEPLSVAAPSCAGIARSTTEPNVSTASTAYYTCSVAGVGTSGITVSDASGAALATTTYSIPLPQVTMFVGDGGAIDVSFVLTLDPSKAPITVDNFLGYVKAGYYDGTIFHRVLAGFVAQGGGYLPLADGAPVAKPGLRAPIALEVGKGLSNLQWSIGMARTGDPDSATAQFYINLADNTFLDPNADSRGYAVFGSVTDGTQAISSIAAAPCEQVLTFSECAPKPGLIITSAVRSR